MSHIRMSHVTHANESCTYKRVMLHIWASRVTCVSHTFIWYRGCAKRLGFSISRFRDLVLLPTATDLHVCICMSYDTYSWVPRLFHLCHDSFMSATTLSCVPWLIRMMLWVMSHIWSVAVCCSVLQCVAVCCLGLILIRMMYGVHETLRCLGLLSTGWRRLIGSHKLQIIFHKRDTKYRSLLREMTCKDKGSYESSPPCTTTSFTSAISRATWIIRMRHDSFICAMTPS